MAKFPLGAAGSADPALSGEHPHLREVAPRVLPVSLFVPQVFCRVHRRGGPERTRCQAAGGTRLQQQGGSRVWQLQV